MKDTLKSMWDELTFRLWFFRKKIKLKLETARVTKWARWCDGIALMDYLNFDEALVFAEEEATLHRPIVVNLKPMVIIDQNKRKTKNENVSIIVL